jgi:hypothetical protein
MVSTTSGLAESIARDGVVPGRHFLFVDAIDPVIIEAFIEDRLRRVDGDAWPGLAEKIGRLVTGSSRTTPRVAVASGR